MIDTTVGKAYREFTERFKLLISKNPQLIVTTLSNIFTMRLIGNKTHGDLAEIAIAEFINQYMYDFTSIHVGKDMYRAKEHEEDITVKNEITKAEFPISLKAYGDGPLQLSTDKTSQMYPALCAVGKKIEGKQLLELLGGAAFHDMDNLNIMPLIYNEAAQKCNILVFDYVRAKKAISRCECHVEGSGRKHPVYRFYDESGGYVCEVRYGDATANALQRGLWTHTKNGLKYFDSLTGGWIDYKHNLVLVKLFSHALVSTQTGHEAALEQVKSDIARTKKQLGLR